MGSLFLKHVEKIVFLAVLVFCAYWGRQSMQEYTSSRTQTQEIKQYIKAVNDILANRPPEKFTPKPWLETVKAQRYGPFTAIDVSPRVFWFTPAADYEQRAYAQGRLSPPSEVTTSATRNAVRLSWTLSNICYCEPLEFHIFRRSGDQKEYPSRRYALVQVGDWPMLDPAHWRTSGAETIPLVLAPAAGEAAGRPTSENDALALRRTFSFTDNNVEPNTVYWYRVRVRARMLTKAELPKSKLGIRKPGPNEEDPDLSDPELANVEEIAGRVYWTTVFSGQVSARTPSDVRLVFKGTVGVQPHWKARVEVKKWNRAESQWVAYMAETDKRERIIGARRVMKDGKLVEETCDSGFSLVDIVRGIEYVDGKPVLVNKIIVKNDATGETRDFHFGVEEKDEEEVKPSIPEETEEEQPRRGGRRTRGREAD